MSIYARSVPLLLGLTFGAAIWLSSPLLTGQMEPWDVPGVYYPAVLLVAGLLGGWATPSSWPLVGIGIYAGEALVFTSRAAVHRPADGFWSLGLWSLAVYSLVALVGAGLGALVGRRPRSGRPDEA